MKDTLAGMAGVILMMSAGELDGMGFLSPQTFSYAVVAFLLVRMDGSIRGLTKAVNEHFGGKR